MADEVEVVAPAAEQPEAAKPPSHREVLEQRFDKFVQSESEGATQDAPAGEKPADEAPVKPEAAAADAKPDEKTPVEEPAKIEVTPEQLADTKYWGSLDADGWKRMERDYPVATAHVKAGQAAASRIVAEKRAAVAATPPPERHDETPSDEEFSPEYLEAVELSQSLDVKEAAKGRRLLAKFDAQVIAKEIGVDPEANKQQAVAQSAFTAAVKEVPELAKYDMQELAKIVEADPALKYLVEEVGTVQAITAALISSGKTYRDQKVHADVAKKAAEAQAEADKKKNANLKVVQSNARPASADLVNGKGAPPAKPSAWERKSQRYDQEVARQGGKSN
jgi:hypothetical protein